MRITVREAAKLLEVSEKTLYRWVSQGKMPAHRINDQYRFNRAELLEWATAQRLPFSPQLLVEPEDHEPVPGLEESLRAGKIFYRVEGLDKPTVLRSVVALMPLPEEVDREFLYQVLLARETAGSTALGNGVAIPHVRNPIVMHISRPLICLCFLEQPIPFGALDGKPVHALFTMVSPSIKAHLALLSRLAFSLRDAKFAAAIATSASREDIFAETRRMDAALAERAARTEGSSA
jgi:PTS system nitrogen regulatory IIA component